MQEQLLLSKRDGVLEVTFNRPDKYNAISNTMLDGLRNGACLALGSSSPATARRGQPTLAVSVGGGD